MWQQSSEAEALTSCSDRVFFFFSFYPNSYHFLLLYVEASPYTTEPISLTLWASEFAIHQSRFK